jgi:hypothetical protein
MSEKDDKERMLNFIMFKVPATNNEIEDASPCLFIGLAIIAAILVIIAWAMS